MNRRRRRDQVIRPGKEGGDALGASATVRRIAAGREAYAPEDPKHPDYVDVHFEITEEEAPMELELTTPQAVTLFGSDEPDKVVARATRVADSLAKVIRDKKLHAPPPIEKHVRVEGWTLAGTMLGVFPDVVWSRPLVDGDERLGWEARCEARTLAGKLVGSAEAECLYAEANWRNSDDYAVRSMAQTRAVSKALRMPLGFVVHMAGFETTPAEEIPSGGFQAPAAAQGEVVDYLTDNQRKAIYALRSKLKLDEEAFDAELANRFGATISGLSKAEASLVIGELSQKADAL